MSRIGNQANRGSNVLQVNSFACAANTALPHACNMEQQRGCAVKWRVAGDLVNVKENVNDFEALREMSRANFKMQFETLPYQSLSLQ